MTKLDDLVYDLYEVKHDTWEAARRNAETFVKQATRLADPDDHYLYSVTSRIKRPERAAQKIESKIARKSLDTPHDLASVEDAISDWVGVKVACNTTADAKSLISIIEENCGKVNYPEFSKNSDGSDDIVDYINSPKDSGYRAYHAVVLFHSFVDAKLCTVPAEIQIKSRLQDAWGELTHDTSYKSNDTDSLKSHAATAKSMAVMLVAVDELATNLAKDVTYDVAPALPEDASSPNESEDEHDNERGRRQVVTVFHLDRRYALARDESGEVGLIRALWVRDLLADAGTVEPNERIDVDGYLEIGQELLVNAFEDNDNLFFEPVTLQDPAAMGQASAVETIT